MLPACYFRGKIYLNYIRMKKYIITLALAIIACAAPRAMEIESIKFDGEADLNGWYISPSNCAIISEGVLQITNTVRSEKSRAEIVKDLPINKVAGRRIYASAELAQDLTPSVSKWGGKIFLIEGGSNRFYVYAGKYIAPGKSGWEKVSFFTDVPLDSKFLKIHLGVESSSGKAMFKNLKISSQDILAEFSKIANIGFAQKDYELKAFKAFTPAGVGYNASEFDTSETEFAKVPFSIRDFHRNGDKFAVALKSALFPSGLERAETEFAGIEASGKFLYVLHFVSNSKDGDKIGTLEIEGAGGKKAAFPIEAGKNVFDYARASANADCISVAPWQKFGQTYTACVSKFPIPAGFGNIAKLAFTPESGAATWVLLGANISERDVAFPKTWNYTTRADDVWKPMPEKYAPPAAPGSVLDLTSINPKETAGDRGRVIINKKGRLAFEKSPDIPVKFLIHIGGDFKEMSNQKEAAAYAAKLRQNGYNMVRLSPDRDLMRGAKADGELNEKTLDLFFYYISELKKNGIYIEFDAMASGIGYSVGDSWDPREKRNFKYSIYSDDKVKKNWVTGTKKILTTVNPYTGTKLAEDPQLALVIGFNELEFGLSKHGTYTELREEWIKFLKRKYRNDFQKLSEAWKDNIPGGAADFDSLPAFDRSEGNKLNQRSRDINEFITKLERDMLKWFKRQFRAMGFEGPVTNFNMGKSMRNILSRKNADYVAMNNYHAHPSNFIDMGSRISQQSSVGEGINISRAFAATKEHGVPYVITEHGHVFWNKYRYEQGFATGAHSALQGFDGITCFANPVTAKDTPPAVYPFNNAPDVTIRSQEFLTALMFLRGDVAESEYEAVIKINEKDIYKSDSYEYGMDARQSRLSLLTKMSVESSPRYKPAENEIAFDRLGGSSLILHKAYGNIADTQHSDFDLTSAVEEMRKRGMLSKSNRTDVSKGIFESSTEEIYIDTPRKYMTVNTPRLQGMSAPAGETAKLSDFEVIYTQRNSNVTIAAVDGLKPIKEARRFALVISPNSLNSEMSFTDEDMVSLINIGKPPMLVETGKYKVALSTPHWKQMRLWALNMDGSRLQELPLKKSDGRIEAEIDTSKLPIPCVFFELSAM